MANLSISTCHVLCSSSLRGSLFAVKAMAASPHDGTSGGGPQRKTVNVRIKGRVQGVFYRQWTMETARQLGLDGWVRNCSDGSVEALFSGSPDDVQTMIHRCRSGPPASSVSDVEPTTLQLDEFDDLPKGFRIRSSV